MMPAMRIIGKLCIVLAAGCAGVKQAPVDARAQGGPLLVDPSLLGRNQDMSVGYASPRSEAQEEAPVALAQPIAAAQQPVVARSEIAAKEPSAATSAPPAKAPEGISAATADMVPPPKDKEPPPAKAPAKVPAATANVVTPPKDKAPPPAKAPAKVPAAAAAIEPPPKTQAPPPLAKKPEPPLDVEALKARLRDTDAIGLFTKLALKNQVDDLLQQFRAHYLGGQKTSVAALRQAYDMLVLKVLALIQDSDPSLARTISGSREAIWGILADPKKFSSVS
jgi:hypothetical protein